MSALKGKAEALLVRIFLRALMIVVTSKGLGRVNDREGHGASGDCEGDGNKYEDFSHGRTCQKST